MIAIVLLFCAMYFAVTETAMASVSRVRIKTAAERGDARAKNALYLLDHFDRAITTILIGTNIVHIAVAAIVTVAVTRRWGLNAVSLSTIVTTIVVFFAGEMLPKSLGKKYNEKLLLGCAGLMRLLMKLFAPLSALLTAIGNGAAKLSKGDPEISVTEDELYDIIEDMTE
ncbi:MAG TPA: HlyC/CorC family transporter, partial [Clostridiales bacterium]|nr:HlyC/CorC family transporter [Clostridiales bacterium]